jgi:phage virion morphogenesis protein
MIKLELHDDALIAGLARLSDGLDDMPDVMGEIGEYLVRSTKERFNEGTAPDGTPWAKNSPVTLARKNDPNPLIDTKALFENIFHEAGRNEVQVGSSRDQAAVMQFGAAQGEFGAFIGKDKRGRDHFHHLPWGDIPARPFLGLSDEDETALVGIIEEYLAGLVG